MAAAAAGAVQKAAATLENAANAEGAQLFFHSA